MGRACVGLSEKRSRGTTHTAALQGVVTVGSRACAVSGIAGVLSGSSERAARDFAIPIVSASALSEWATEQARIVPRLYDNPEDQMECAVIIRRCGGKTAGLPVTKYEGAYLSADEIFAMALPDELYIVDPYRVRDLEELHGFKFVPGVFITEYGSWMSILQANQFTGWPEFLFAQGGRRLLNSYNTWRRCR